MRLIDADELENFAYEECFGTDEMIQNWIAESDLDDEIKIDWEDQLAALCWKVLEGCMNVIATQPTAFGVETVVEELEALTERHMAISEKAAEIGKAYENHTILNGGKGMAYEHAIEIVRKGGVKNDNRTDD